MSGHRGFIEDSGEVLATATVLTLVQLVTAANHPIVILGWGVSFNSIVSTDEPIGVRLQIQTSAGTSSGGTIGQSVQSRTDTFDTSALIDFTAEPTKGENFPTRMIHAQSGFELWYPQSREIEVADSTRIGLEVTSNVLSASLDQVAGFIHFEE